MTLVRLPRVFVTGISPGERRLDADAAHYVARVLRLREGEPFVAFDPAARLESRAEIVGIARETVTVRLGAGEPARAVPRLDVTLVQCAGKGDKVDEVVRSATALGASSIVVAESSRSIARAVGERAGRKLERWRAIALDAARQSGRGDVPTIEGPRSLDDVLPALSERAAAKLCLDPDAQKPLSSAVPTSGPVVLLVGPEGGLTGEELDLAERAGFVRVKLGPFVLRTELAAAAALGALIARSDETF